MSIVASSIVEDRPQRDGRRAVRERHEDDSGAVCFVDYLAEAKANAKEMLSIRVTQLEEAAVDREQQAADDAAAEKERAQVLLKLEDSALKAVLRLASMDDVAAAKAELTEAVK